MAVEFSEDSNTVKLDGRRFVAYSPGHDRCAGCAFVDGFGCRLAEDFYRDSANIDKLGLTRCQARFREDGRNVIWVLPGQLCK